MRYDFSLATEQDLTFINLKYDEVGFVHSDLKKDQVIIARLDQTVIGLGRLVTIDMMTAELGGIYVFEAYRGKKVAHYIVEKLIELSLVYQSVYCLPFSQLLTFYKKFGFGECLNAPQMIREKHQWCNQFYPDEVLLLRREN